MGKIIIDEDFLKLPFYGYGDTFRVFVHALIKMDWEGCLRATGDMFVDELSKKLQITETEARKGLMGLLANRLILVDHNEILWVANPERFQA